MKVFFLKDHSEGIKKGEIREVSQGYAQNFLIPKGFAVVASLQVIAKVEKENKEAKAKEQRQLIRLQKFKIEAEKRTLTLKVKVGDKGQVFGGVHEKEIAESLSRELGETIEKSQINFLSPIKSLGEHKVKVKFGNKVEAVVKILVSAK